MISLRKIVFVAIALYLFISCNSADKSKTITSDTITSANKTLPPLSFVGCYRLTIEKDSAFLKLKDSSGLLTGPLIYLRYEKDKNTGIFTGIITPKNHLEGWYQFSSEGKISIKQVIFKINNNDLSEGYGDMELRNDTIFFKYPSNLRYEEHHPFIKHDCN